MRAVFNFDVMMFKKSALKKSLLALASLFACGVVTAAEDEESSAPAYRLGGVTAYPGLGVVTKNDSNIFRLGDANPNKRSSKITVWSPTLALQAEKGAHDFSLTYVADIGRYSNSPADDYVDQSILGLADLGLTTRATLTIKPTYLRGHDDRGATFGASTAKPSTWHSAGLYGSFTYGAEEARGRVVLDVGHTDRQYQNNRAVTAAYDRELNSVGGTFYLRVQPSTSLLASVKRTETSYKQTGSTLNSSEQRFWVGVKWDVTEQTSGEVKAGKLKRKFESGLQPYSVGSWECDVRWAPASYLDVDLSSFRQSSETTLAGSSSILQRNSGANIAYDLSDRVTLHLGGYRLKEDFVGANRVDHTNSWSMKAEYQFRGWLIGAVEYTNSARSSSDSLNDYSRNVYLLSVHSVL